MDTGFRMLDPSNSCFVVPYKRHSPMHGFTLYVGEKVSRYTTPPFEVHRTNLTIRLKIGTQTNSTSDVRPIQLLLVEPEDDIIAIEVNKTRAVLTSGSDSFLYQKPADGTWDHGSGTGSAAKYIFWIMRYSQWSPDYRCLETEDEANVELHADGEVIETRKELLVAHSDVFRAMFEHETKERQTGIIKIKDNAFPVVKEMIRFMLHGYCGLWYTHYEELAAIADKYDIRGMKELAAAKKRLIDELF